MDWMQEFKRIGALWIHDENPKRPHVVLASGLHYKQKPPALAGVCVLKRSSLLY